MKREHLIALGLAGAAVVAVVLLKPDEDPAMPGTSKPKGGRVFYKYRVNGGHPSLVMFLDWWEAHGDFPIAVTDGGPRTQAQVDSNFAAGTSKARSVSETPHGPRLLAGKTVFCAIDVAPAVLDSTGSRCTALDYSDWSKFERIAAAAKSGFGLVWGGTFTTLKDGPHLEVANWKSLPFSPGVV